MRFSVLITLTVFVIVMVPAQAVESPYSGLENRNIKALSKKQIDGYLTGKGMRLALPGELNGYPGPKHVLEMESKLELSASQRESVVEVFEIMQSQAISLGKQIIAAEAALDDAFASGTIDEARLQDLTGEIAQLKGRLRAVHLQAHLETKVLLSGDQVRRYVKLRGYHHADH